MKTIIHFSLMLLFSIALSFCSTPRKNTSTTMYGGIRHDTIILQVRTISFQKELAGKWNVISMRRQQKAELEMLNNVSLSFQETDTRFSGKAPCNNITGMILLNGYGIRFKNMVATRMACQNLEQESAFLNLLETRVSAFTIDDNKLYLRDGVSNIVFECEREK
jgi:heat shock protein HslJ